MGSLSLLQGLNLGLPHCRQFFTSWPTREARPVPQGQQEQLLTTAGPGCWKMLLYSPAAAMSLQSCPTLCDPTGSSPPGSRPWDSPGKNTGVGCHFLLQCMKVKSESEVAQSCLTPRDLRDYSLPGSSVHVIFQTTVLEWGATAFSNAILRC